MTSVPRPHRDALNHALDLFRDGMRPFLIRCLRTIPGSNVERAIKNSLPDKKREWFEQNIRASGGNSADYIDVNDFPHLVQKNWRDAFKSAFPDNDPVISKLWMVADARNQAAHPGTSDLDVEYVRTHLFIIADLLERINNPEAAQGVTALRDELFAGLESTEPVAVPLLPSEAAKETAVASHQLKPWREVMPPNRDVAEGVFQQAEFMADLQRVHDGSADANIYGNPLNFFAQTYITPGLKSLLENALRRLAGLGGDPVVQTKTGFGGGKTHSLIALYHLVKNFAALTNDPLSEQPQQTSREIRDIAAAAGLSPEQEPAAAIAVLDGQFIAPSDPHTTDDGDPLNTLWGVMAWQLGGQDAYNLIGQAAREGTAPGGRQLDDLFAYVGPCLILIDEPLRYISNAGGERRERIYTFMQALTQAATRSSQVFVVLTLPQNAVEVGGETGQEAMAQLESVLGNIMHRAEATWEPLAVNEAFAVVRRRLFGEVVDTAARDSTCAAFATMYGNGGREYPSYAREQNYRQRMQDCYPIHPEIFDRLYQDWSSIPEFQSTRGVLRLLATCVSRLYQDGNAAPLIMPADLPLSYDKLAGEFNRLLSGNWSPVLTEVDAPGGQADLIDGTSTRFSEYGVARRIARAIFLGSATSGATKGIDRRSIHLAVAQPGHGLPRYNEALERMVDSLYYLYYQDNRYYFHAEENLNKVVTDRKNVLLPRADEKIIEQLKAAVGSRQDVIVCPADSSAVADADWVRTIVLAPSQSINSRSAESNDAKPAIRDLLTQRGGAPRIHRNTLLFLTARKDEIRALRDAAGTWLAWHSITSGEQALTGLSQERRRQAANSLREADSDLRKALVQAYRWAIAPVQHNPQQAADYNLSSWLTNAAAHDNPGDIIGSALQTFNKEEVLLNQLSPSILEQQLEQYIWASSAHPHHIALKDLWDIFTSNVYLHRLARREVLDQAIANAVAEGRCGYAGGHNGSQYLEPLRFRVGLDDLPQQLPGLLVKAATAERELLPPAGPETPASPYPVGPSVPDLSRIQEGPDASPVSAAAGNRPRRITVRQTLTGNISLDTVNQLREEIIRNLSDDGGSVTVEITIRAVKDAGFSESIARAVRENGQQLGLNWEAE